MRVRSGRKTVLTHTRTARAGRLNSVSLSRSELTVVLWFGTGWRRHGLGPEEAEAGRVALRGAQSEVAARVAEEAERRDKDGGLVARLSERAEALAEMGAQLLGA